MAKRILSVRRVLWSSGLLVVGLFVALVVFSGCMSFEMKDAEVRELFTSRGQSVPVFFEHKDAEGSVFVAKTGTGPSVVFVHGSPGTWDNYAHVLSDESLNSRYTLVAVDRPGFGRSLPKGAEPSLEVQARRIREAVVAAGVPMPAVWVGHSLGGPVVARLAADSPEVVAGLVLVAPSMDPKLEIRRWYNWAAKFPLVKWGLSREWRNSNEEIFPLRAELELLEKKLGTIRVPTIVLQGDSDELVPKENAEYVKREMPEGVAEVRMLEGVNHFIPWTNTDEMKQAVDDVWAKAKEGQ